MGRSDYYSSCSCKLTTKFAFLFAGPRRQVQNNPAAAVNLRSVPPRACNPNTAMRDFRPCTSLSSCCFPGHGSRPRSPCCGYEAAAEQHRRGKWAPTKPPCAEACPTGAPNAAAGRARVGAGGPEEPQTDPNEATAASGAKHRARKASGKRTFLNSQLGSSEGSLADTCFWCKQQSIFRHADHILLSASLESRPAGLKHSSTHRERATTRSRPRPEHTALSTRGVKK